MVATTVPPTLPKPPDPSLLLPPPPPLDPTLITPPPTTIYSGGVVPGQQVPAVPAPPPGAPPVSTVVGGIRPDGTPAPTTASALSRLQAAYKEKTGLDLTPEVQDKLMRGESIGLSRPTAGEAPTVTPGPRGYQTLRGRESAANVGLTQAQTGEVTTRTGIAQSAEARAERESREKATGYTGGEPITAGDLSIDLTGINKPDGSVNIDLFNKVSEKVAPLLTAMGYDLSTPAGKTALEDLLHGKTIIPPRMRTIDAQKTISEIASDNRRLDLMDREVTVGEQSAAWQKIMDRAKATGDFTDPETGLTTRTLEKWDTQMREGAVTGFYEGNDTLQAKMAKWGQESQDKAIFGFDRKNEDGTTTHVYGTNELAVAMKKLDQDFQKDLLAGFDYVDEDGETRHIKGQQELITDERTFSERVRTGYDEVVLGRDGKPIMIGGEPLIKHIEGTQELSARLAKRTAELQERGMNLEDAQRTADREWEQRRYAGYDQIVTDTEGNPILRNGQPMIRRIEGTAGLEIARMRSAEAMQQAGIDAQTAEWVAEEQYQDKVRNGYWTTDERGHQIRIRGTQEDQAYLLRLSDELGGNREEAQRQYDEEQRVGYDRYMDTPTGPKRVHITGTQEFVANQSKASWAQQERARTGYFRVKPGGGMEWVPGTEVLRDQDGNLVSTDEARIASAERMAQKERMHDRYVLLRTQQFNKSEAEANREWQTGERALDRALDKTLQKLNLAASENRLEAEGRMQLLATSIAAMATLGGGLAKLVFGGEDSVGDWFVNGIANGEITAENFGDKVKSKLGLSTAEAAAVGTAVKEGVADTAVDGAMRGMPGQQLVGTGPASTFGSQLAGAVVPAAIGTAFVYGGYAMAKYFTGQEAEEDRFDNWYETELPPAQRAEFRGILSRSVASWDDDRGEVLSYMKEAQEARARGEDITNFGEQTTAGEARRFGNMPADGSQNARVARDLVFKLEEMQAQDAVRIAAGIRDLADKGVFPADGKYNVGSLTRAQKTDLLDAWSRMPSDYRKAELPETMWQRPLDKWSVSTEQLEAMRQDLAKYGVDNGVRSSAQLAKDIADTVTKLGPKIARINDEVARRPIRETDLRIAIPGGTLPANTPDPMYNDLTGALTLDEENTIRALWLQRGGDPRVPLAIQATRLTPPPTSAGGTDQVKSVSEQWQTWFKDYSPKIGD